MANMTWKERNEERKRTYEAHRKQMEEDYGLSNHPKAELLYAICWDLGHSSGLSEVAAYYSQLSDLLKED